MTLTLILLRLCTEVLRLVMAVKGTLNPPGTTELVARLEALRSVLYWDRPGMRLEETVRAATVELGGTQEALVRLLTLCAAACRVVEALEAYAIRTYNCQGQACRWMPHPGIPLRSVAAI